MGGRGVHVIVMNVPYVVLKHEIRWAGLLGADVILHRRPAPTNQMVDPPPVYY